MSLRLESLAGALVSRELADYGSEVRRGRMTSLVAAAPHEEAAYD